MASLNLIATDSPIHAAARRIPGWSSRGRSSAEQEHWSMTFGTSADWQEGISRKLRRNQRWKKLAKDYSGNLRIDELRTAADLDRMSADMEEIARKTYQRGLGAGFNNDESTRARLRLEAEKGWLRIYILYLAGRPCAFWSGSRYGDTFFSGDMGYDPADARYSPGMFLIMKVIENFQSHEGNRQVARIDWGLGGAEYKRELSDRKWLECSPSIWAPTLRGWKLHFQHAAADTIDRAAKAFLQKTTLILAAKRLWRNRLQEVERAPVAPEMGGKTKARAEECEPEAAVSLEDVAR
jgi:CelD/BcsL family acetyltransferase involved in cellulose biosynthesis